MKACARRESVALTRTAQRCSTGYVVYNVRRQHTNPPPSKAVHPSVAKANWNMRRRAIAFAGSEFPDHGQALLAWPIPSRSMLADVRCNGAFAGGLLVATGHPPCVGGSGRKWSAAAKRLIRHADLQTRWTSRPIATPWQLVVQGDIGPRQGMALLATSVRVSDLSNPSTSWLTTTIATDRRDHES